MQAAQIHKKRREGINRALKKHSTFKTPNVKDKHATIGEKKRYKINT